MPDFRLAAERAARKYNVNPRVFLAMIQQESGFRPSADSGQARGIAQFTPGTAKSYGVNLNDGRVTDDLEGAARYLRDNLKRTGGNYHQALSIYNSGRPDAYKNPGFAQGQTYNYVRKILGSSGSQKLSAGGSAAVKPAASRGALGTPGTPAVTTSRTVPDEQGRRMAVAQFLLNRHDPSALTTALSAFNDATKTVTSTTPGTPGTRPASAPSAATGPSVGGGGGGAHAAVAFAQSRVGQYKESSGSNRGPQLNSLESKFGYAGGGAPWCAMFTSVAVTRGGAPKTARTASVGEIYRQAQTGTGGYLKGFQSKPKAGDLMVFGTDQHIGMVESVNSDGSVNTIEGNTGQGKVSRVRRGAGSGQFVRPKYTR